MEGRSENRSLYENIHSVSFRDGVLYESLHINFILKSGQSHRSKSDECSFKYAIISRKFLHIFELDRCNGMQHS